MNEPEPKRQRLLNSSENVSTLSLSSLSSIGLLDPLNQADIRNYSEEQVSEFQRSWLDSEEKPFSHMRLEQIITDDGFLQQVLAELQSPQITWYDKRNDLYEFRQSKDLRTSDSPLLTRFRQLIYSEAMLSLVERITGMQGLSRHHIDIFAAIYSRGSMLLPHDDRLEGRKIAYIFYLTPPDWAEAEGGHLDLYSAEQDPAHSGLEGPYRVSSSLLPQWNSLAFFQVSTKSFHQVREVLSDRPRISIGGWFHGSSQFVLPSSSSLSSALSSTLSSSSNLSSSSSTSSMQLASFIAPHLPLPHPLIQPPGCDLKDWINPMYLQPSVVAQIQEAMAENGAMELPMFLHPRKFNALAACFGQLRGASENGVCPPGTLMAGPVHKRRYFRIDAGREKEAKALLEFFGSRQLVEFLWRISGAGGDLPSFVEAPELRYFSPGCYTLMHDEDSCNSVASLDANLSFSGCDDPEGEWEDKFGGFLAFITGDEEPFTISPQYNALSLVMRQPGTLKFVKYLTERATSHRIDLTLSLKQE